MLACAAVATVGCQDAWDDHYGQTADTSYGNASLYEIISQRSELSDFRQVLDSARLYANGRITSTHYRDLLDADQFFTIWAPVNGTFNKDSLLQLCATSEGDSLVEHHFLKNHMARYSHSVNGKDGIVRLFNEKDMAFNNDVFDQSHIVTANIASRNGLIHIIEQPSTYYYNIYEALFSLDEFKHVGKFFRSYQIDEFNDKASLPMGVVDGKTIYADSVFTSFNSLMWTYGEIDSEDSTYWMLVPEKEIWDSLYAEAETYYNFGSLPKADSIHNYWSNYALLQDLVYNPHDQRSIRDSLCSTQWSSYYAGKYHVAYNPFEAGGLFTDFADSLACSNGTIYKLKGWPFTKEQGYFKEIIREAEGVIYENFESATKELRLNTYAASSDSVSNGRYLYVTPNTVTSSYYLTYEVPNVLSGCYDVCIVMLPKTVYNPAYTPSSNSREFLPCKFTAEVVYTDVLGEEHSLRTGTRYTYDPTQAKVYQESTDTSAPYLFEPNNGKAFVNNPYRVDTIKLATIHFPTCNYAQQKCTTRVKITNNISSNDQRKYNANMLIDCIMFRPHVETENE